MYKKYFIKIEEKTYKYIDYDVRNLYAFKKSKIPYIKDILFLEHKYIKMIDNN